MWAVLRPCPLLACLRLTFHAVMCISLGPGPTQALQVFFGASGNCTRWPAAVNVFCSLPEYQWRDCRTSQVDAVASQTLKHRFSGHEEALNQEHQDINQGLKKMFQRMEEDENQEHQDINQGLKKMFQGWKRTKTKSTRTSTKDSKRCFKGWKRTKTKSTRKSTQDSKRFSKGWKRMKTKSTRKSIKDSKGFFPRAWA